MKYIIRFLFFCSASLFVCCGNRNINDRLAELDAIKELGDSCPTEALRRLAVIGTGINEEPEYIRNKYALLNIRLCDKAFITHTTDSVIKRVCSYFEENGSNRELQEAYYYMGSVYRDMNDSPQAITFFLKAVDIAESNEDYDTLLLKNSYSQLTHLYNMQFNHTEALKVALKGYDLSIKCGIANERTIMTLVSTYKEVLDTINTLLFCDKAFDNIINKEINVQNADIFAQMMSIYARYGSKEKATCCYEKLQQLGEDEYPRNYYINLAMYYEECVSIDSTHSVMLKMLEMPRLESVYNSSRWLTRYYYSKGDYENAAKCAIVFINSNEALIDNRELEHTTNANNIYKYNRNIEERLRIMADNKRYQFYMLGSAFLATLILLLMFVFFYYQKKKLLKAILAKDKELKNTRLLISDLENDLLREQAEFEKKQKELELKIANNKALSGQLSEAEDKLKLLLAQNNELFKLSMTQNFSGSAGDIVNKCTEAANGKIRFKDEDWKQLFGAINQVYPEFIIEIQRRFRTIKEPVLRVWCLWKIGLSNPQIARITGYPPQTVWDRVHRIEEAFGSTLR